MLGTFALRRLVPALLLVLVVGFVVALQVTPAYAATITVTGNGITKATDGVCTLPEAFDNSNDDAATWVDCGTGTGADTIDFDATYTIALTAQLVVLDTDALTIQGPVTVSSSQRVFLIGSDTVNDVISRSLTLNGVIVQNGQGKGNSGASASVNGGCILVRPNSILDLNGSTVRNCFSDGTGGGIYGDEEAVITINQASLIDSNTASVNGGGVGISTGVLTIDGDSCVQNNFVFAVGGGIYAGDSVYITIGGGSTSNRGFIVGNTSNTGGGVYMDVNSTLDGNHARFFGNTAALGGAVYSEGGSGRLSENVVGRRCINCCIVGNSDQAIRQTINGLNATFVDNWWGNDFGPFILSAGATTASGTSRGDSITGDGISAVNVGIVTTPADYGSESTGGDHFWLRLADGNVPSDCTTDVCSGTSGTVATRGSRSCVYSK